MNRFDGKGRQADRDVHCARSPGRAVPHPLATLCQHRLAGMNLDGSALVLDAQHPLEHDGIFVELGV